MTHIHGWEMQFHKITTFFPSPFPFFHFCWIGFKQVHSLQDCVKRKGKFGGCQKYTNYTLNSPLPRLVAALLASQQSSGIPKQSKASEQATPFSGNSIVPNATTSHRYAFSSSSMDRTRLESPSENPGLHCPLTCLVNCHSFLLQAPTQENTTQNNPENSQLSQSHSHTISRETEVLRAAGTKPSWN